MTNKQSTNKQSTTVAAAKTDPAKTTAPEKSDQLGWAWTDIVGVQMNNAKTLGEVSRVFARTAQELGSEQTTFMKANAEAMQNAASTYGGTDPSERLARQSELYREIMERSVDHVSAVTETVSESCCEAMDHMTETAASSAAKVAHQGSCEHTSK